MKHIANESDAELAIHDSARKPIIVYKHSPICGLSDTAITEFEKFRARESDRFDFYQVDVIGARKASRKIEELLGVRHESPQVLMIWDSRCLWHGSHRTLQADRLRTEAEAFWSALPPG